MDATQAGQPLAGADRPRVQVFSPQPRQTVAVTQPLTMTGQAWVQSPAVVVVAGTPI
ncbi:MAG: hypothetical protein ACYCXA_11950 [Actinomycetes bacterium]